MAGDWSVRRTLSGTGFSLWREGGGGVNRENILFSFFFHILCFCEILFCGPHHLSKGAQLTSVLTS